MVLPVGLLQLLRDKAKSQKHILIGICGFGGAGKTTAAIQLAEELKNTVIIHLDDFILDRLDERSADWQGFDWNRLITQVLKPIKSGEEKIKYGAYNWAKNETKEKRSLVIPTYIILEGVGLFRPELNPYFDLKIYVDAPHAIALERGKKRDNGENSAQWDNLWQHNDRDYHALYDPKAEADIVIDNN